MIGAIELSRTFPAFTVGRVGVLDHGVSESIKVTSEYFNRKQDGNNHKVEHIVDRGTSKSTLQLISITHLAQANDGVGDTAR